MNWKRAFSRRKPPVVAVLRLDGTIGASASRFRGSMLNIQSQAARIERAFKIRKLSAVALVVNSPGGSPVQSALIAGRIRVLAEERELPVIAFAEDVAASGGYWLACAADEIFVNEATILGSIGVISAGFGFHELIEKYGIERRVHAAGENKAILDPFLPERPRMWNGSSRPRQASTITSKTMFVRDAVIVWTGIRLSCFRGRSGLERAPLNWGLQMVWVTFELCCARSTGMMFNLFPSRDESQ